MPIRASFYWNIMEHHHQQQKWSWFFSLCSMCFQNEFQPLKHINRECFGFKNRSYTCFWGQNSKHWLNSYILKKTLCGTLNCASMRQSRNESTWPHLTPNLLTPKHRWKTFIIFFLFYIKNESKIEKLNISPWLWKKLVSLIYVYRTCPMHIHRYFNKKWFKSHELILLALLCLV